MSRMIWVWDEGHCGALICVASDREEAMDKFAEQEPTWDLSPLDDDEEGDDPRLKSYELDVVAVTRGYEP
jgi:hypothetical protein